MDEVVKALQDLLKRLKQCRPLRGSVLESYEYGKIYRRKTTFQVRKVPPEPKP